MRRLALSQDILKYEQWKDQSNLSMSRKVGVWPTAYVCRPANLAGGFPRSIGNPFEVEVRLHVAITIKEGPCLSK